MLYSDGIQVISALLSKQVMQAMNTQCFVYEHSVFVACVCLYTANSNNYGSPEPKGKGRTYEREKLAVSGDSKKRNRTKFTLYMDSEP